MNFDLHGHSRSGGPAPASAARPGKTSAARVVLAVLGCAGFAFPVVAALCCKASFLAFSNESVAYRFFLSERILAGEGATAMSMQGFLTTAIQTTLEAAINAAGFLSPADLPGHLAVFSYAYSAVMVLVVAATFIMAARRKAIPTGGLALMCLALYCAMYLTRDTGFHWALAPDYYQLDTASSIFALFLFQAWWVRDPVMSATRGFCRAFGGGLLAGMMTANKVTMIVVGTMPLVPILFSRPFGWKSILARTAAAALGMIVGFGFVLVWLYHFSPKIAGLVLERWAPAVLLQSRGGDLDFWGANFAKYLIGNSYLFLAVFYLFALVLSFSGNRNSANRAAHCLTVLAAACGGIALAYAVIRRPAGTTLYETAVSLLVLGCMVLVPILPGRRTSWVIGIAGVLAVGGIVATFPLQTEIGGLQGSGRWGIGTWRLHRDLLAFGAGHPIVDVIPSNNYIYSGVEECLLKGTANWLSWDLSPAGRPLLERFSPGTTFRYDGGGISPNAPYPPGTVIFWVDVPYAPAISTRYPTLVSLERGSARKAEWRLADDITAHAIEVPPTP